MKTKLFFLFTFFFFQFAVAKEVVFVDPVAPSLSPITYCDSNNDGFGVFDLTVQNTAILAAQSSSVTDYIISYHDNLTSAQVGGGAFGNPSAYYNISSWSQIIYYRIIDVNTSAYAVGSFQLIVNSSPLAVSMSSIAVCDADANPMNGITSVDLTQQTPVILAGQPLPSSNYAVAFYTTQAAAEAGVGTIINAASYVGSNGQTIWYRVENNVSHCNNVGSFQLTVDSPLLLVTPPSLNLCDSDASPNNQYTTFNLTVKNNEITQGLAGYAVTYYPSLADAQNNTNAIANPTAYVNVQPAVQTLGVRVIGSNGCSSLTTLDIRVYPVPVPNTNPSALAPQCDVNNTGDMLEVFDLTVNAAYIMNGNPNLILHFYLTQADALANLHQILTPTAALVGVNVWIRVENVWTDYQGNHCFVLVEQPLRVNPLPTIVQPLAPYRMCDDNADGIAHFDLTNPLLAQAILGPSPLPTGFTISYYLSSANAASGTAPLPSPYTNVVPSQQNIYIRVVKNATGCVNATGQLTLAVEANATATGPQTYASCDNYGNPYDGVGLIDLTAYAPAILNGQNPAIFLLSYYTSLADASAGTNGLTPAQATAYQTDAGVDTIWVKVENSSNSITPFCYAITTIDISVIPSPNPIINTVNNVSTICVDFMTNEVVRPLTLRSGVPNPSAYSFIWRENGGAIVGTDPTYTVNTAAVGGATRNYSVTVTGNNALGCQATSSAYSVMQSGPAAVPPFTNGYTITSLSGVQSIMVNITGYSYGNYEYSLDNGPHQASNIFENVSLGSHTIYVWDTEGGLFYSCDPLVINGVEITLGIDDNEIPAMQFAPNPVKDSLALHSAVQIKSVSVYTILGQKVFEQNYNDTNISIDLSRLSTGNYIMKARGESGEKTIRIVKE